MNVQLVLCSIVVLPLTLSQSRSAHRTINRTVAGSPKSSTWSQSLFRTYTSMYALEYFVNLKVLRPAPGDVLSSPPYCSFRAFFASSSDT